MFCYKCGRKISDDSDYCPYCGQQLPDLSGETTKQRHRQTEQKKHTAHIGWLAVLSIIVIVVLVAGYALKSFSPDLLKSLEPTSASPEPPAEAESSVAASPEPAKRPDYDIKGYWKTDKSINFYLVVEEGTYTTDLPGIAVRSHASVISPPTSLQILSASMDGKPEPDGMIKPVVKEPGHQWTTAEALDLASTDGYSYEELTAGVLTYHFISEDTITVRITSTGSTFTLYRGKLGL